jgi:hypothetical protein
MTHATIIGGGFYGCALAVHLATKRGFAVDLYERENDLMMRASRVNQARVHSGLHYPRSMETASRCVTNLPRFCEAYPEAVFNGFNALYAIPYEGSLVTPKMFEDFAEQANIPIQRPHSGRLSLFNRDTIAAVYEVYEPVFNVDVLRKTMKRQLAEACVQVHRGERYNFTIADLYLASDSWIFDCSYAAIHWPEVEKLLTEVVLIEPPARLRHIGITVMDGPTFFSVMPFPSKYGTHSLTDVKHTVHTWDDYGSNFDLMRSNAAKYVPCMKDARFESSLFDVKALMKDTDGTSARPILIRQGGTQPHIVTIVGSKVDNVFNALDAVDAILEKG